MRNALTRADLLGLQMIKVALSDVQGLLWNHSGNLRVNLNVVELRTTSSALACE